MGLGGGAASAGPKGRRPLAPEEGAGPPQSHRRLPLAGGPLLLGARSALWLLQHRHL